MIFFSEKNWYDLYTVHEKAILIATCTDNTLDVIVTSVKIYDWNAAIDGKSTDITSCLSRRALNRPALFYSNVPLITNIYYFVNARDETNNLIYPMWITVSRVGM